MHAGEFLLSPVDEVDHRARNSDRGKDRGHDAQAVHHGKASHRAGTENQKRQTRDKTRDVGVKNRIKGRIVTFADRELRRSSDSQFFTYAFVNQNVCVNGHTQGKRNSRDTGKRERCLQHRKDGDKAHDVADKGNRAYDTEDLVVEHHEDRNHRKAVERGAETRFNVVGTKARPDQTFFHDFHGSSK